ncbi:hypothetical protein ABE056_05075 [Priestia aryabhattai]|uniref:hypothetical protein n=1 Tax=Priestia aryabhattai TaxID=412384 RepID=UPI003D2942BF
MRVELAKVFIQGMEQQRHFNEKMIKLESKQKSLNSKIDNLNKTVKQGGTN